MNDKLMGAKAPDQFTTESPIRAFSEFRVAGCMAIGKGFRPSVAHLHTYLDAMARKESWRFVQLLHVDTADMTIIFERQEVVTLASQITVTEPKPHQNDLGAPHDTMLWISMNDMMDHQSGIYEAGCWWIVTRMDGDTITRKLPAKTPRAWKLGVDTPWVYGSSDPVMPELRSKLQRTHPRFRPSVVFGVHEMSEEEAIDDDIRELDRDQARRDTLAGLPDDPVNPRHYRGTACAEIGERLSGNSYQTLKYNWRLGDKDDPCVEIDKSIWYLDREINLAETEGFRPVDGLLPDQAFFAHRVQAENEHVKLVCGLLVAWNRTGDSDCLHQLRCKLIEKRVHLDCGRGLAV